VFQLRIGEPDHIREAAGRQRIGEIVGSGRNAKRGDKPDRRKRPDETPAN